MLPTQGDVGPLIVLGCAGGVVTTTGSELAAEVPQAVRAETDTVPLLPEAIALMLAVELVPLHPEGSVQV